MESRLQGRKAFKPKAAQRPRLGGSQVPGLGRNCPPHCLPAFTVGFPATALRRPEWRRPGMASQDPFYLVRGEVQEAVNRVQEGYTAFERLSSGDPSRETLALGLLEEAQGVTWQLQELSRTVDVAARDPGRFSVPAEEVEARRTWTESTRHQVLAVTQALEEAAWDRRPDVKESAQSARRELFSSSAEPRGPTDGRGEAGAGESQWGNASEVDHALLIREQDEQLDVMTSTLSRISRMGMSIHEELGGQDKIIGELSQGVESSMAGLGVIQKRMGAVMKKAGLKGQLAMFCVLLLLFVFLVLLLMYS